MVFDKVRDFGYFSVIQDATILNNRVAVTLNEELGRAPFRELTITRMNMHALHHTEGGEIQIHPSE